MIIIIVVTAHDASRSHEAGDCAAGAEAAAASPLLPPSGWRDEKQGSHTRTGSV
jgi:hypothetical protein